jgi:hypothetical protein
MVDGEMNLEEENHNFINAYKNDDNVKDLVKKLDKIESRVELWLLLFYFRQIFGPIAELFENLDL